MFLKKLIVLQILNVLTIKAIQNKNSMTTVQGVHQKGEQKYIKEHVNALDYPNRHKKLEHQQVLAKAVKHSRSHNKKYKIQLPHNYIPFKKASKQHNLQTSSRRYKNSKFIKNMPVFDAAPGDDTFSPTRPIFIYTGNKGRMLLNTMLSSHKYPMQEPVPGQVLYPPSALIFKPKILVDNFQQQLNVTMIPFYAYEAIDPRRAQNQQITTTSSSSLSFITGKKHKKAKQYTAFYSPQEVLSQPVTDLSQYYYQIDYTTNSPPSVELPYTNHHLENLPLSTTTPLPHKKFEVMYNDGEDKFQITYEDDSAHLERPLNNKTTTQFRPTSEPLPHQSYTIDKNYYTFPVYTMAKLLEKELQETRKSDKNLIEEPQRIEKSIDTGLKEQNKSNEDTWFILNSRYKGHLKTNKNNNLHSSKYIQASPLKLQKNMDLIK